jgi:hypothetical protein
MTEPGEKSPVVRLSRLFRKAGVFLSKSQFDQALIVLREGEGLARSIGDEEKRVLFLDEIVRCEKQLAQK